MNIMGELSLLCTIFPQKVIVIISWSNAHCTIVYLSCSLATCAFLVLPFFLKERNDNFPTKALLFILFSTSKSIQSSFLQMPSLCELKELVLAEGGVTKRTFLNNSQSRARTMPRWKISQQSSSKDIIKRARNKMFYTITWLGNIA